MNIQKNPFVDLYVTEHVSADKFVKIFSPVLVEDNETHILFQSGNVILTGLQGSGKTALLNLLKPEVLIAYFKNDIEWPLPEHCARFISAGINLARSSAMDFGQRQVEKGNQDSNKLIALYFADFINYWIVDDLLNTLDVFGKEASSSAARYLGLNIKVDLLNQFAQTISQKNCWLGGLGSVSSYQELREKIDSRITAYRDFLNFNSELSEDIQLSKTSPGEPISVVTDELKEFGVIPEELPIFIRIDQFEDLMGLEKEHDGAFSGLFRSTIMKFIGTRDERVSYRIGARPYSYYPDFSMYGTSASVEELRNFRILDIGNLLGGKESKKSLFPRFADDVFKRRLTEAGIFLTSKKQLAITQVFGKKPLPKDRARDYVKNNVAGVFNKFPKEYPNEIKKFLLGLAKKDPLSAKLGEAWVLQQLAKKNPEVSLHSIKELPWEKSEKKWWKKERIQQALLQISACKQQRMKWYGGEDIVSLSGRNILVFLSLNQFIWSEYLRSNNSYEGGSGKSIPASVQDMGIQETSAYWFRKVKADPNGGSDRHRFVNVLGSLFRSKLREDKKMSYPGTNGFSLSESVLDENSAVADFLDKCVAYGVLETKKHTPKTRSRGQSRKWYLSSILSPYFQIPTPHTKEPFYAKYDDLFDWLHVAKFLPEESVPTKKSKITKSDNTLQHDLFGAEDKK